MFTLGIIPARGGSKGIPRKNLYPLNGKCLIDYTLDIALNSECLVDEVIVSTDDEDIADRGYLCVKRPKELSEDDTPMLPVIQHTVKAFENDMDIKVDSVVILQPTSPLRTMEDINNAIKAFNGSDCDSLYSGYYMGIKTKDKVFDKHTASKHFQRNGAIFIASRDLIMNKGKIWSDNAIEFEMPKSRSIDIDDLDDMFMAEAILKHMEGNK